ncbi:MAG: VOC family protein [Acidimicrobiales bacterium]
MAATDPFESLRQPEAPTSPSPAFAASLRRRLADLLDPTPPGATMSTTEPTSRAAGTGLRLRPYLVVDGADAAIAFYAEVFGARVVGDLIRGDDGRVGHAELEIDGNGLYLADAYPEYGIPAPDPAVGVALHLEVADADDTVARAEAAGASVLRPVADQFYGSRSGTLRDPFGHQWQIDAPGTGGMTPTDAQDDMAESGFAYETVDLGQRAAADRPSDAGDEPATRAPSIGYFTVDAPDGARAAAFYGALLGWDARPGSQPGGFHVENIEPPGGIDGSKTEPGVTVYFRVDDVGAAAARVRELGGTVLQEATYPSGGNASCLDDQGVPFQLWQPAPGY